MNKTVLGIISNAMAELNLNYEFGRYTDVVSYPYFVGEYLEGITDDESGREQSTFILTGWTRNSWLDLENAKEQIKKYFSKIGGHTLVTNNNNGVAIFYDNSLIVPQENADLKCMQINLSVQLWDVSLYI